MKGKNYRVPSGMPHTRREYIRGIPNPKIARFSTGIASPDYDTLVQLVATGRAQIRHNALEAARVAANKKLVSVGEANYFLQVRVYPHVVLRENKMIATAGADRLQEGMRNAFGKPIGLAARVKPGTTLFELRVKAVNAVTASEALRGAASKLPIPCEVSVQTLTPAIAGARG